MKVFKASLKMNGKTFEYICENRQLGAAFDEFLDWMEIEWEMSVRKTMLPLVMGTIDVDD